MYVHTEEPSIPLAQCVYPMETTVQFIVKDAWPQVSKNSEEFIFYSYTTKNMAIDMSTVASGDMSTVSSLEGDQRKPKGAVLFTGLDGIGDNRVSVSEQHYIGCGFASPESSSDTQYIFRAAKGCAHPPPKTSRVGEVGWGVPRHSDYSLLKSGHQIMLKEFRQAVEDRHTHLYQTPYYPPPYNDSSQTTSKSTLPTTDLVKMEGTQSQSQTSISEKS